MSVQEVVRFLKENPKYREIVERAIEIEERNIKNPNWLGWEWYDVRAYPAQLVRLVIGGITRLTFKSKSSTTYQLVDREAALEAIQSLRT